MTIKLPKWQQDAIDKQGVDGRLYMNMARQSGKSTIVKNWAKTLEQFAQGFRLELSEGTVFGQKYYCVEPQGWIWRDFEFKDMQAWCESTMERESDTITPNLRWYVNGGQFWFRDETDRTMFVMRWV
jgi:hypothetical protein